MSPSGIDPDKGRGTITFYELSVTSLMGMPEAGVEPARAASRRADRHGTDPGLPPARVTSS